MRGAGGGRQFSVSLPFSLRAFSHPLSTQETRDSIVTRHGQSLHSTSRISYVSLDLHSLALRQPSSPVFDHISTSAVSICHCISTARLYSTREAFPLVKTSRRAVDGSDDCFVLFFRISCTRPHGAADHSVSKRCSDGGYSYVLPFSESAARCSRHFMVLANGREGWTEEMQMTASVGDYRKLMFLIPRLLHWTSSTRILTCATHCCYVFVPFQSLPPSLSMDVLSFSHHLLQIDAERGRGEDRTTPVYCGEFFAG